VLLWLTYCICSMRNFLLANTIYWRVPAPQEKKKYLLGYEDVRIYYASWAEWGMAADTPVET
jgi:ABC-type Fe2+-enterobactin transport system substrate-binding protein